jgi:hypothetical protein
VVKKGGGGQTVVVEREERVNCHCEKGKRGCRGLNSLVVEKGERVQMS